VAYAGAALVAARGRPRVATAFAALHVGYGVGLLRGLTRFGSR
jgi:hypothetical protein